MLLELSTDYISYKLCIFDWSFTLLLIQASFHCNVLLGHICINSHCSFSLCLRNAACSKSTSDILQRLAMLSKYLDGLTHLV